MALVPCARRMASEVASRHVEVAGIFAVAVQNRGDLAVATCAASCALAEFGADDGDEVVFFRHDETAPTTHGVRARFTDVWFCLRQGGQARTRPGAKRSS